MFSIIPSQLPDQALLKKYLDDGAYTDCYKVEIPGDITQEQYINAFYTTSVFKLERVILKLAFSKASSDSQVAQLAEGKTDTFAAWHVEGRTDKQLLLSDFRGSTRSWLMTATGNNENSNTTRLYFGSAVVPVTNSKTGESKLGWSYKALLGFHKLYSKVLLYSAKQRLLKQHG